MKTPTSLSKLASFKKFLWDKLWLVLITFLSWLVLLSFLMALHTRLEIIVLVSVVIYGILISSLIIEYTRKRRFYYDLLDHLDHLDQAYLVLETLEAPAFYDGEILFNALYKINKSMTENVARFRHQTQDFQEYVEMWIHEVKTPLATLAVIARDPRINEQIKRLDDYVEQILYFARAENAERDYLIKPTSLAKVVGVVANRNREIMQAKSIDFTANNLDYIIQTDAKWLEFIINQIINNSIKYQSSKITISAAETKEQVQLTIRDNGLGIEARDLPRVFDKSFTGSNGRRTQKTTGMGLYIAQTLCHKLGHQISIDSIVGQYTAVTITFAKNEYYKVLDLTKK